MIDTIFERITIGTLLLLFFLAIGYATNYYVRQSGEKRNWVELVIRLEERDCELFNCPKWE